MTTIKIFEENQVIDVKFEQYDAHEPFGIGYFVRDVKVIVYLENTRDSQVETEIRKSLRAVITECITLKDELELNDQHIFICELEDVIEFDYLHQLEESISEQIPLLAKELDRVGVQYQIEIPLGFFND